MKTSRIVLLLAAGLSPLALLVSGCSKTDSSSTAVETVKADSKAVAADVKASVIDTWDSVKDYTYEKRADFSADMDRMAGRLDDKTSELKAKFASLPAATAKDREDAMKEYDAARADLKSKLSDLSKATADTWADSKASVAESWKRLRAAYEKVKADVAS
jgi:outer membrane murein-binding lipoprotein Lpp